MKVLSELTDYQGHYRRRWNWCEQTGFLSIIKMWKGFSHASRVKRRMMNHGDESAHHDSHRTSNLWSAFLCAHQTAHSALWSGNRASCQRWPAAFSLKRTQTNRFQLGERGLWEDEGKPTKPAIEKPPKRQQMENSGLVSLFKLANYIIIWTGSSLHARTHRLCGGFHNS